MSTGSFPGVKRPRCGVDQPTPYSAEVKERVHLYRCSPPGHSWPVIGLALLAKGTVVITYASNMSFNKHPLVLYVNCSYQIRC